MMAVLGLTDWLVGRSHECDFPPGVEALPVCTAPNFKVEGTSNEIDQRVKSLLSQGLSVYQVQEETLRQVAPEVILTQTQCEVCAVSFAEVERAVGECLGYTPTVVDLAPQDLDEVWSAMRRLAGTLGIPELGHTVVYQLEKRIEEIAALTAAQKNRPSVVCIEWLDPLMGAGNWVPTLVNLAGGQTAFGQSGQHSPWITWEHIVQYNPDVLVLLPCGFDIPRTLAETHLLTQRPEWPTLRAVQTGRVAVIDGNQYFNRPGPRLVESLEILTEILHPQLPGWGHQGVGWINLKP
jgi:iron complex transport system substrate-binding protein